MATGLEEKLSSKLLNSTFKKLTLYHIMLMQKGWYIFFFLLSQNNSSSEVIGYILHSDPR